MSSIVIGNGFIGRNLGYRLRCPVLGRDKIDLLGEYELPESEVYYICAGMTKTQECEENPYKAISVNVDGTVRCMQQCREKMGKVVFLSSERAIKPTTMYGLSKATAEVELLNRGCTVIRLSKVLGWDIPLFEGWINDLKHEREIYPFKNMAMSPLPIDFVCDVLARIGDGFYQLSGEYDITYDRIAYHIANYMGADMDLVRPVEAKEGRPHTAMDSSRIVREQGLNIPDCWEVIYRWCRDRIN